MKKKEKKIASSPSDPFRQSNRVHLFITAPATLFRLIWAEQHSVICLTVLLDGSKCPIMIMGTVISTAWLTFPSTFGDQNPISSEMLFIHPVLSQRVFFFKLIYWRHRIQTIGRLNFKVKRRSWWQVGEKKVPAAINVCEVLVEEVMCFPARTQHIRGAVYWRALNLERQV